MQDHIRNSKLFHRGLSLVLVAGLLGLTACEKKLGAEEQAASSSDIVLTTEAESEGVMAIAALGLNANVLPSIEGVTIDGQAEDLAPVNLTVGVINSVVKDLQQRLMNLGYMEEDEPTTYYGDATSKAVQYFQRQTGRKMDGITGVDTWDALMSESAPHYAAKLGFQGDDITKIQYRLYNLGYLTESGQINGTFDQDTETAVKKLQEVNKLTIDGTVGQTTYNLLYSDEVKANIIALGEQSEIVKKYQNRLIALGYLSGEADGNFGLSTQNAIRAFQSRNDQVVDGYLGPDTRSLMDSENAKPFGMRLGEQSDDVKNMQNLLVKYGYLSQDKASGYFGELTKDAVIAFQSVNGLGTDGTAGAKTLQLLQSGTAKSKPKPKAKANTPSRGNRGGAAGGNSAPAGRGDTGSGGSVSSGVGGATVSGSAGSLISIASSKIGSPYVWGAKGPNSFDCSGFVYWCLNQAGVGTSYMTSSGWRNPGRFKKVSMGELQAGDIVVVRGHVGIYAGGGSVIDASSSNGRVVHRSLSGWWANNFITAWRIFS
ncbi:C40 family peptidase [Oribacterium sinus]|jgi:peptidoglycan-binding domain 1 (fragment)|uniref:Peptidoglycan hydrolase-like protein with peptidoglycan-binding domain n=5 Tax=Oribacterium sinus TaxID=237576 RepID=A0A7W9SEM4_9FIRM|nr:peptidoglycan-binding protein [Oribacterium sinus]MBB6040065.1 peptidoglycan hydrolase-like protein with peptidoglycan-binding domain [Oribacterium sinus]